MKGNAQVVELLNEVLTAELTAINQYFVHAEMCRHWGYQLLYDAVRKHSIDEMRHAEKLIERILYLDGIPNLQRLGKVIIGEKVAEQLGMDLALESEAVKRVNEGILRCEQAQDSGSRQLLEAILAAEEEHIDWLEAQQELIRQVGEPGYLSQQIRNQDK